jgi:predicted alpha-1,2-mannosidase
MNHGKALSINNILPLCLLGSVLIPSASFPQTTDDPAALVNPFVGTGLSRLHDYGKTIPGATRPFGMLYWSPDTVDEVFYVYERPVTRGFSLTHISGPGCGLFGDVPIFPMLGVPGKSPATNAYQASFSHAHERAEPGFYEVTLDSGINVRLAASVRSGIAEFRFPPGRPSHTLLIDLGHNLSTKIRDAEIRIHGRIVTGSVSSGGLCGLPNRYKVYFALETAQTPETHGTFDQTGVAAESSAATGPHTGGFLSFGSGTETVEMCVGISFVSAANAEANFRSEIGARNLEEIQQEARTAWNNAFGRARVSGGLEEDRKVFYTALYHSLLHPSVFSDVNGEYIGFDDKVHLASGRTQYANFSGWDIYRCQVQLLAMLFPEVASDIAQSLVVDAEEGGGLPVWAAANDEVGAMVGDPSACILAGIYGFGARGFDAKAALAAMLRGANDPSVRSREILQRPGLEEYLRLGYVPDRGRGGSGGASVTLEYENADFAISRLAGALGDFTSERTLLTRSAQWRKLFDADVKYIRARGADGRFLRGFSPGNEAGFVEGNSAQYTWMIPYDLAGVIAAVGGGKEARKRLDDYFSQYYDYSLKNGPYFAIGNEPSFGNPWIYNWTGHPWRAQEVVRKTLRDLFSSRPDGLPGNDDLGATSAWVAFAQLGMYPEIPGVGGLTLNSPTFPEATLRMGDHSLRITAKGAPKKPFVEKIQLDGVPVRNWWINWERLSAAKNLNFSLSTKPNRSPGQQPPSFEPTEK